MKKLLVSVMLIAGVSLGFAKENVESKIENENIPTKQISVENGKEIFKLKFSSREDIEKFLEECKDVVYAFEEMVLPDGSTEAVLVSYCESTYPCVYGGIRVYVIYV